MQGQDAEQGVGMSVQVPGHGSGRQVAWFGVRPSRPARLAVALMVAGALVACSPQIRHHGYVPDDAALSTIEVGRSTRDDVVSVIGPPRATGVMEDSAWIYVGSRWEQRAPRPAVEVSRDLVAISFDGRGVVRNVERFSLEDGQAVPLSRRITETSVREQGFFSRILRNVGRFSADQFVD